ncbi:MAG: sarcosine oxidase subunit delta [Cyanobacteria bacterium Co-bin8]|nr:sarcosine oxidase subunit delta [Cyanobacteria bacterium Co-bin8]
MSFQLTCPNCGRRSVSEFACKGEFTPRPLPDAGLLDWTDYLYLRQNRRGRQLEWWYHRSGCQSWFLVERDTTDNTQHRSFWYRDLQGTPEDLSR